MPHIFPRRFLRTRDILDPKEFNEDIQPVKELVSGRLDRTNFSAQNLKAELRAHPDRPTDFDPSLTGPCVAEGAYFNVHSSSIESEYRMVKELHFFTSREPPNFVELDGVTFRRTIGSPTDADAYPSIVSNGGDWSPVKSADLSDSQRVTFTTGQSNVWISAYVQYIWQGFYEEKPPWISGDRRYEGNPDLTTPDSGDTWEGMEKSLESERDVLNLIGPSRDWESLPDGRTSNDGENLVSNEAHYAFPLNEPTTKRERRAPSRQGMHHISKGFFPSLVQFALRVDGKIIEETITGKRLPFEESSHGLSVTDSIPSIEKDDDEKDSDPSILETLVPGYNESGVVFGQRSVGGSSGYGDSSNSRPGQKLRSDRAVSYGPEVMPVRLGAVVELQPGEHTIEIVARRLQRKKSKFSQGDFVGVFSRRLLAFDLPVYPSRQEPNSDSDSVYGDVGNTPGFLTEDRLTDVNIRNSREALAADLNNVKSANIDDNVFSNDYLPSKVVYSLSDTIESPLTVLSDGRYDALYTRSIAPFPGFMNTDRLNTVLPDAVLSGGWADGTVGADAGWSHLQDNDEVKLSIVVPTDEQVLRPNEKLILMMDVEVRGIYPMYSTEAAILDILVSISPGDGVMLSHRYGNFGNHVVAERYLDLFALFAIGYKKAGNWVIGSGSVPAMVNSFNWVNRAPSFTASKSRTLPIGIESGEVWDYVSGWARVDGAEVGAFFQGNEHSSVNAPTIQGRGTRLKSSNLGINVPIMQVIENTGTTDITISEFGGFASTMCPGRWTSGYSPENQRENEDGATLYGGWVSPVGGRKILDGVRVNYGNSRLTAIKITK
tara:strand:- start:1388 stop:3877 length:2490 start_codon:yes stop_codon:yes gene_type:complete